MSQSSSDEEPTNNYSYLMAKVGHDGPYQWIIYSIAITYWMSYGIFVNSIPLLYLDVQFDCTSFSIPQIECEHYICQNIPAADRHLYLKEKTIESLATEFGHYHC